ncbi:MAG: hypothetical protein JW741_18710 [Sedimentisphaerales bacterium]|nr:hypothetical protein [Sedimentisphaerales bacterium]
MGALGYIIDLSGVLKDKSFREWLCDKIQYGRFLFLKAHHRLMGNNLTQETCYKYKGATLSQTFMQEAINYFAQHYNINPHTYNNIQYPIHILWHNDKKTIDPDALRAYPLDTSPPDPICDRHQRAYVKFLEERGEIKHEGINYCMNEIDLSGTIPKISARLGLFYDNLISQYGIERELIHLANKNLPTLETFKEQLCLKGSLPLRDKAERGIDNPLTNGTTRCTSITASMMLVFKRSDGYYYILSKRSKEVAASGSKYHVAPAGFCEVSCDEPDREWSFKYNLFRELLEELYGIKELTKQKDTNPEYIYGKHPLPLVEECLKGNRAEFTVTGLCVDLLNLRPEVCTLLLLHDEQFCQCEIVKNWESQKIQRKPLSHLDSLLETEINPLNSVPSGATCLHLGRNWLHNHGLL